MFTFFKSLSVASPVRSKIILLALLIATFHLVLFISVILNAHQYPLLSGLALLAYGLGLRHAVDPDHIAAIDNTTRKLMQDGQQPVAVGFFFAFGHASIVVVMCALVALSATFLNRYLPAFKETGALVGTSVSCLFLLAIGVINMIVLVQTWKTWRKLVQGEGFSEQSLEEHLHSQGLLTNILRPLLKVITKSWQMFVIGLLFGLGFDTASEVALLSLSGTTSASGMPFWQLMLVPLTFAAGMSLIDTLDGILMLGAYGWAFLKPARKLYYNMNITFISAVVALLIGGIEGAQILSNRFGFTGGFWAAANNIKIADWGFYIIALFVSCWCASMLFYKWRKMDQLAN
jgi:nickel/cobalt transporter (NiCoT) family protein